MRFSHGVRHGESARNVFDCLSNRVVIYSVEIIATQVPFQLQGKRVPIVGS